MKKIIALSLSLLALSSYADALNGYSLVDNGYKCLVDPKGEEVTPLYDKFTKLTSVRTYKDNLVAMGDIDFGQMTVILDKDGEVLDSFMHFYLSNPWGEDRPALQSPSGRYLLFRKFHSPFSAESETSNFAMYYDLDLSPAKNRVVDFFREDEEEIEEEDVYCGQRYAGKYLFPQNAELECSTCSAYKTLVYDEENYLYILGNKWDTPKTVLQLNYPKAGVNDFLIVEETEEGLTQKLLKFNQAKLFDKEGKALEYSKEIEDNFYMVDFTLEGNTLTINNLKDSSIVAKIIFEL